MYIRLRTLTPSSLTTYGDIVDGLFLLLQLSNKDIEPKCTWTTCPCVAEKILLSVSAHDLWCNETGLFHAFILKHGRGLSVWVHLSIIHWGFVYYEIRVALSMTENILPICLNELNVPSARSSGKDAALNNMIFLHRYGGWSFGKPLPPDLKMDLYDVPKNRTLAKVTHSNYHVLYVYSVWLMNLAIKSMTLSWKMLRIQSH